MRYFQILLCLLFIQPLFAQIQEQNIKTDIDAVRVYLQGAEIIRTKNLNLPKGKHRLIFNGLSPLLDARSIQVNASENTSILSLTSKTNFQNPQKSSGKVRVLRDSIKLLTDMRQDWYDLQRAYQKEEEILQKNQDLKGNEKGLTTDELIKVTNFYRERFREIFKEKTKINRAVAKINENMSRINGQLSQMNSGSRRTSEIYVELNVKSPVTTKLKVRYVVGSAGWSPVYDLRAGELNEPIKLTYRALAYNNTGTDWNDVKITLSTADPYQSASKPLLSPWRLNQYNFASNSNRFQQGQGRLNSQVQVLDNVMNEDEFAGDNSQPLPNAPGGGVVRFEQIEVSELSNDFEIDEPYTIPADRKPYSIDIVTHELNATYRHYAVPKLDKDAFLLAQVTGWEALDLIDGPMNVYHGERYVGEANLSTRTLRDTLDLSLGRDKNVIVTRVKQKELSKKQYFSKDLKVTMAYKINIKNNHNRPINIEIQDQIPISNNKDIVVSLKDKDGAEYTGATGKLVWKFNNVKSGEKKAIDFSFTIKHPKSMPIQYEKKRNRYVPRYK